MKERFNWPVLKRYEDDYLARIALPLGGIGTGTVSLGGRGDLRDWEIVNRPAKGFAPTNTFFALWAQRDNGQAIMRCLEGPLDSSAYEGASGSPARQHGLPRFRQCAFEAAYPLGQVVLQDPDMPLEVRLQAFNPLIPADTDRSGIPVAILRYVLANTSDEPVQAAVCGNLQNFIGRDGTTDLTRGNVNEFRQRQGARGLFLSSRGVPADAETWGTLALATTSTRPVSYRTSWAHSEWSYDLLDFWDDFSEDGRLQERSATSEDQTPLASLCVEVALAPGATEEITFLLAWHFPNRMTWTPEPVATAPAAAAAVNSATTSSDTAAACCAEAACAAANPAREDSSPNLIGNYYTTRYADAWEVAERTATELPQLEAATLTFVRAFCDSDLPTVVKEAALFNLSTLRTQTCFRTPDGLFYGWEGCGDRSGCCDGSCTHVWNYEQATAFLFGELSSGMRKVEFEHATDERGLMSFRVHLPLRYATRYGLAAADGQMGCLMKLYRDWQLSGDSAWLRELWPHARRALEFCWVPGGWDGDRDGVMEGCQHNTMDVEYYGPNPQMEGWYLGALRACEEMARYLGEDTLACDCRDLFERGRRWTDEHLWNGEYYEHQIRPPHDADAIAPGLRHRSLPSAFARNAEEPELQLGSGCLVDQLVGQFMAHISGLGYLLDQEHVRATLQNIVRYNFKESLWGHFNHTRTFALGDEAALLMATYPHGQRPPRPFPYCNEVMTGFEYTVAVHLCYEGRVADALKVMEAIRARYDGRRRNPFDEAECGHHYARAMASWGAVLAWTGFAYSAITETMHFAAAPEARCDFWSNGWAWGTCKQKSVADQKEVCLRVLHGTLSLRRLTLDGFGTVRLPQPQALKAGESVLLVVSA